MMQPSFRVSHKRLGLKRGAPLVFARDEVGERRESMADVTGEGEDVQGHTTNLPTSQSRMSHCLQR